VVQAAPPALLELAQRLRQLRQQRWSDVRLTQEALATALGGVAPATVSSWESPTVPKLPPRDRLLLYARFFATRRSIDAGPEPKLLPLNAFTADERTAYDELQEELLGLREVARKPSLAEVGTVRRSWHFTDSGPATLVCAQLPEDETAKLALAKRGDPNYTELLSFADLDALVELHGHIRAENPSMGVFYKAAPNVVPDDLSGHVILLGGIAWNEITRRLSAMTSLPVEQVADPSVPTGEIFVSKGEGKERTFLPTWGDTEHRNLVEDVGFLARVPNPFNPGRTLTICNGIHSRGVLGAVRSLTDARLRDSNEQYISENFGNTDSFVILMRVPVIEGQAMTPGFQIPGSILYQWPQGPSK
jgi:hypothetical protein